MAFRSLTRLPLPTLQFKTWGNALTRPSRIVEWPKLWQIRYLFHSLFPIIKHETLFPMIWPFSQKGLWYQVWRLGAGHTKGKQRNTRESKGISQRKVWGGGAELFVQSEFLDSSMYFQSPRMIHTVQTQVTPLDCVETLRNMFPEEEECWLKESQVCIIFCVMSWKGTVLAMSLIQEQGYEQLTFHLM